VPPRQTDAGLEPVTASDPALTVQLTCEVCGEELLAAFPRRRARYGAVDCPCCGSSYLFLLDPGAGAGKAARPSAGVA